MGMSVQLQQAVGMVMGKYFAALNMPTRADLVAVNARVKNIEDQLPRLSQQVASTSAEFSQAALNMPTRADLAAMDARLRAIEDQLARLAQQVAKASEKPAAPAPPIDAEAPRSKRAQPAQPPSRPGPAEAPAAARVAAQAAHAAKPARRVAKKPGKAS